MSVRVLGAIAVVAVGALIALAGPAAGDHTDQADPDDTPGRWDLEAVAFDHDAIPTWRFDTFAGWTVREMWDRGGLAVLLDTKGDAEPHYVAVVRSTGRGLESNLFRLRRNGRAIEISRLRSGKVGARGAWVSVSLGKVVVGASRTSYFWSALSSFTGPRCRQTCIDVVPDEGMIEQPLATGSPPPTPSPSPTPSPTPTPTPSPTPTPTPTA